METGVTGVARSDYRELVDHVRGLGLLDKRTRYYAFKISVTVAAYGCGWAGFVAVGNSWWTLAVAVSLAMLFTQVVFIGHDAGHMQVTGSARTNRLVGLVVGDALTGVSFGWWVPKHNAHHAHPNELGRDPDIAAGGLSFTVAGDAVAGRAGWARWFVRRQAWFFFPLLMLQGLGLHVSGVQAVMRSRGRTARAEVLLLGLHGAVYLTAIFWVLSPGKALAFLALQQGLFGLYLGCSFAPNHKGMPLVDRDAVESYLTRQVITARNVRGGAVATFLLGGLNYQIEHHLFPSMPRPNLRRVQSVVRAYCSEHALPYSEDTLVGSFGRILRYLDTAGRLAA